GDDDGLRGSVVAEHFMANARVGLAVISVGQENVYLDQVSDRHSGRFENGFEIAPGEPALALETLRDLLFLVQWHLRVDEQEPGRSGGRYGHAVTAGLRV